MDLNDLLIWVESKIKECETNITEYEKIEYNAHAIREKGKMMAYGEMRSKLMDNM